MIKLEHGDILKIKSFSRKMWYFIVLERKSPSKYLLYNFYDGKIQKKKLNFGKCSKIDICKLFKD